MHPDQCTSNTSFHVCVSVHKLLIDNISPLLMLELCVTLCAASQVLKKHEEEFFDVVSPKRNLLWLKRKEVISEGLLAKIEAADSRDAKEILFEHLHHNADVAALREYCKMAIAADSFPKMQKLGEKMQNELTLEGLLVQCIL